MNMEMGRRMSRDKGKAISRVVAVLAVGAAGQSAYAQLQVSPAHKFAWSENCGYLNFKDAGDPDGAQGVRVHGAFLSGYVWGENIGWIHLGSGAGPYVNTNGTNYGVNYNGGTGALSGYAWAENVGWVNFSGGAMAVPANGARIDVGAQRLRGYAWGENIGWINLDDATKYVGLACPADLDDGSGNGVPDGGVDINDLLFFLMAFEAGTLPADLDNGTGNGVPDGGVDINDLLFFLGRFEQGC